MEKYKIAFIGAGNMAGSLIGGLITDGFNPEHISASDPDGPTLKHLADRYGIQTFGDNKRAVEFSDVLVLAVKPHILETAVKEIPALIQIKHPLVISIAAGVRESDILVWLGQDTALVRAMPNTPSMIQAGATVLHATENVTAQQRSTAESVLRAVGLTLWVEEETQLDAVTALSGSGPAYFFLIMEAMEEAGIALGLEPDVARLLTLQTALGASKMAMESSDTPAILRSRVTSPGGTTERALSTLEKGDIRELFKQALSDAHTRSQELSNLLGNR